MKILMIDSLVGNDYALILCSNLQKAGVQVTMVTTKGRQIPPHSDFTVEHWAPSKDPKIKKTLKVLGYLGYLGRIFAFALNSRTVPVHFQFFRIERIESLFLLCLKVLGTPTVYTAHNILPHENNRIDYLLRNITFRSSNLIIVHSDYIKNSLIEGFRVPRKKICTIPHGNFDAYLPKTPISKKEARKKLSVPENSKVLLFFGYIRKYKGIDLLLESFEIASKQDQHLTLIIAGKCQTEKLLTRYQQRISQIPSRKRIRFDPEYVPTEKVPWYFVASDLVALPYINIDHSGIVHLAYSFGRPVIATEVGDFPETIEQGKTGYIVKRNDGQELAAVILKAFSNMSRLEEMGEEARKLSKTKYSWGNIAKLTARVYKSLARKPSRSGRFFAEKSR
ncbi:MAG: glycosyltransferase family 4 protein [Deltaproteobacteria bacterium]|uniref:Glycosyltransferase family 4 protein n=1 Tax=Candidatus Desulfacyla euxinica TaxID=2841693 RepID=A0A8J6T7W2_9DELT|nr:glycosyltransferase family 4 protein [Candidatus Desulfacyla euxinica]MBL7217584.1 glycosyltransferase family 4 protein [Desulfobacteraceae bacterium]